MSFPFRLPADLQDQNEVWGANCGPYAAAVVAGVDVAEVRSAFPGWEGHTTQKIMKQALDLLGVDFRLAGPDRYDVREHTGLAFVHWRPPGGGSWGHWARQRQNSHWIVFSAGTIVDAPTSVTMAAHPALSPPSWRVYLASVPAALGYGGLDLRSALLVNAQTGGESAQPRFLPLRGTR